MWLVVRRIHEDCCERSVLRLVSRPTQPPGRVGDDDARARPEEARGPQVALDELADAPAVLDEDGQPRAARQRLDARGAAAGVEIEERLVAQLRLQDREQALLDPVAQR